MRWYEDCGFYCGGSFCWWCCGFWWWCFVEWFVGDFVFWNGYWFVDCYCE